MSPKATTLLLIMGLLGLLAVTACLADPLPQPAGGMMPPQGEPGAPARQLLTDKKDHQKPYPTYWYCYYHGHFYEPFSHHHGHYCCYGKWTIHKCK
jgi:hypothetical protein